MTDVDCTMDIGREVMRLMNHDHCHDHNHENCADYVPKMNFAGFGRAYVPNQRLCELFSGQDGFVAGTIFPELHIPYDGNVLRSQNLNDKEADDLA